MIFARILTLALILFEALNLIGILHFTLDFAWTGLLITSIGVMVLVELVYWKLRRIGTNIPAYPYLLASLGLWIDALGDVAHWYGRFNWYDQTAHFIGGAIVMAIAIEITRSYLKDIRSWRVIFLIALFSVSFFGSVYEIEEYLEDKYFHGRQVRLGDGPDTVNDILLNILGGVTLGGLSLVFRRK